jgi:hypothetical protein
LLLGTPASRSATPGEPGVGQGSDAGQSLALDEMVCGRIAPRWAHRNLPGQVRLRVHLLSFFGNIGLSQITPGKVQDYRIHRIKTCKRTAIRHAWLSNLPNLSPPYRKQGKISHRSRNNPNPVLPDESPAPTDKVFPGDFLKLSSSAVVGSLRCVARGCPSTRQANLSDTPSFVTALFTQSRRRAGLRSFPPRLLRPFSHQSAPTASAPIDKASAIFQTSCRPKRPFDFPRLHGRQHSRK